MFSCRGKRRALFWLAALSLTLSGVASGAATPLADGPLFDNKVPANLALALSVEYPTAISVANLGNYDDAQTYLGYFDPNKCYLYQFNSAAPAQSYFYPVGKVLGSGAGMIHSCNHISTWGWSGNFMNWATMPAIDPFRWALTGGYRAVDEVGLTILEKAWFPSNQGGAIEFPDRGTSGADGHKLSLNTDTVTQFNWGSNDQRRNDCFKTRIANQGNALIFTCKGNLTGNIQDWRNQTAPENNYRLYIRVKVCDPAVGLEENCVKYGNSYKPEGLLQKYADKVRYSAFSYLNDSANTRQGGVMRARMGFIGPTYPLPLAAPAENTRAEWDAATGIMDPNPDRALAAGSGVNRSGVMNYLNRFGQDGKNYKQYDNVSELYYAVIRYFRNQGNVLEWTSGLNATKLDGFPAPTSWDGMDPISYRCQKNIILGIGDVLTHLDSNTGGRGSLDAKNRALPAEVTATGDPINKSHEWTTKIEALEGLGHRGGRWHSRSNDTNNGASAYIAGLAYGAHVNDIRSDLAGTQTISTYWVDVMEGQKLYNKNPYWLAAKYGGFDVPSGYTLGASLTPGQWNRNGRSYSTVSPSAIDQGKAVTEDTKLPDNYFPANDANAMVAGLTQAFASIASSVAAYTTALSPASLEVPGAGVASYTARYDAQGWTGTIAAGTLTLGNPPAMVESWSTDATLSTQFGNTGWDTSRRVLTWNGKAGVPFRATSITHAQKSALNTPYRGNDADDYLNYLRGDRTHEQDSTATGRSKAYRARTRLLGDIVNAKITFAGPPSQLYSNTANPGYAAFKSAQRTRTPMLLAAANDGMLHVLNGALNGASAGQEIFAYVPSAVFTGPRGNAGADGLAALGNPDYAHRFYVDATPKVFDVDFSRVDGAIDTTPDWRSIVVGGLGKGGKSFYAIDITNPAAMTSEAAVAGKVLWEFSHPTMGFSYGAPLMVKTRKYGWTLILTSGYNSADSVGYLYFVNPKTGELLEAPVPTPSTAPGLTQAAAYFQDYSDGTADAVYVGDLNGQLWRFDITGTGTGSYPTPTLLFTATNAAGQAQPITTAPLAEIHPLQRKRYVLFGTGKMLDASDIPSTSEQSFYAIQDGTSKAFAANTRDFTRNDLTAIANPTSPPVISGSGWYHDFGLDAQAGGLAWRMVANPVSNAGQVGFATLLPSTDPCQPLGTGRIYALDFATGESVLASGTAFVSIDSPITELGFLSNNGKIGLYGGNGGGGISGNPLKNPASAAAKLINWREIMVTD